MKGIILAGGTGSRLYPITKLINKHVLPVGRYPMIYHAVYKLKECGITDIMIITGRNHMGDIAARLGSGMDFHVSFTYRVQERAGGIAEALSLCREFVGSDNMLVLLGDNIFSDSLVPYVEAYKQQERGAKVLLKEVGDPCRFGVPVIQDGVITAIEEKPRHPKSFYAVTGIYMYDTYAFQIIETIKPSARDEIEITDLNNEYIRRGEMKHAVLEGWWIDAGTHDSLQLANTLAREVYLGPAFDIS